VTSDKIAGDTPIQLRSGQALASTKDRIALSNVFLNFAGLEEKSEVRIKKF
jgi:hypothetical protein